MVAPDILVLDLRMPGKDGIAVLAEMRRESLATHVVLLTAIRQQGVGNRHVDELLQREPGIRTTKSLTPCELQIARIVAEHLPSKHVAGRLAITEDTAKLHLKLNLRGRIALMRTCSATASTETRVNRAPPSRRPWLRGP